MFQWRAVTRRKAFHRRHLSSHMMFTVSPWYGIGCRAPACAGSVWAVGSTIWIHSLITGEVWRFYHAREGIFARHRFPGGTQSARRSRRDVDHFCSHRRSASFYPRDIAGRARVWYRELPTVSCLLQRGVFCCCLSFIIVRFATVQPTTLWAVWRHQANSCGFCPLTYARSPRGDYTLLLRIKLYTAALGYHAPVWTSLNNSNAAGWAEYYLRVYLAAATMPL